MSFLTPSVFVLSFCVSVRPSVPSVKKRRRHSRSPSVEIIYEGVTVTAVSPLPIKHNHKRRRKQRHYLTLQHSPMVITIDSDSDNKHTVQTSTLEDDCALDLSDRSLTVPGLPLGDHNLDTGVDISDFAVDILDRSLSVSDRNSDIDHNDVIDRETNVDDDCAVGLSVNVKEGHVLHQVNLSCDPGVATSDSRLLATILQDLEHITLPNLTFFPNLNPDPNHSRNSTTPDHREIARPAREIAPTHWSSEGENARPAREIAPTHWSSEGENARPAREIAPTHWSSEGETNFNSPVSPTANHSPSSESFTDYHPASPISPVGHPASPISPVGHPASPISPVGHSASPISPVGHPASPISPVGHPASPISPIGHSDSPVHHNSSAVSPVVHHSDSPLSSPIAGSISVENPCLPSSTGSSVSASPVSASPVSASPVSASRDQEGPNAVYSAD
eukprot:XP_014061806.1 PREDICTED: uncharacterized protein LOC106608405 isoform X14 [Salmo salar]